MSIVTKTGDKGMTSLYLGGRVRKDDPRVDLYGTLDELCSFLGMAKCLVKNKKINPAPSNFANDGTRKIIVPSCPRSKLQGFQRRGGIKNMIENMQKDIFTICTELATKNQYADKLKNKIDEVSVNRVEGFIKDLETKKALMRKGFCVPGENFISSVFDVARTVARRAERKIVALARRKVIGNEQILIYVNRMSDLLYLLARLCEEKKYAKRSGSV